MCSIELLSNGIRHITGVCINCKKKMSANEDKSEIARAPDVATEFSKMQMVVLCMAIPLVIIHSCAIVKLCLLTNHIKPRGTHC